MEKIYVIMLGVDGFGNDEVVAEECGFFIDEIAAQKCVRDLNRRMLENNNEDITNWSYHEDENGDEVFFKEEEVEEFLDYIGNREYAAIGFHRYSELYLNK